MSNFIISSVVLNIADNRRCRERHQNVMTLWHYWHVTLYANREIRPVFEACLYLRPSFVPVFKDLHCSVCKNKLCIYNKRKFLNPRSKSHRLNANLNLLQLAHSVCLYYTILHYTMYYVALGFVAILLTLLLIIEPNYKRVLEYSLSYSPSPPVINYWDSTVLYGIHERIQIATKI